MGDAVLCVFPLVSEQHAQNRKVFPMKLDRDTLLCWGLLALTVILTIAILPPIGIILWPWLGLLFLTMWGMEQIAAVMENRKRGE